MKFHPTLIKLLVQTMETYSGWTGEKRLIEALSTLDLTVYKQQSGVDVLVSTEEMNKLVRGNR